MVNRETVNRMAGWLRRLLPYSALAMLVALSSALAEEGAWSRFRGPNGNGISDAKTVPGKWSEKDYNWKVALPGAGNSSPVVWDGRVFLTCGDPKTATRTVLCLKAADGSVLWRKDFPSKPYDQPADNGYATATPAVDADGVVVTWTTPDEVTLLALDLEGRELWRRNLGPFVTVQGSGISPIIVADMVVLDNSQENTALVPGHKEPAAVGKSSWIAVDRKTGATRWQVDRPVSFSSYGTPCVYTAKDGRKELIFTSTPKGMSGVEPATGKILWELNQEFLDRTIASPVIAEGLILAGCGGMRGSRYVAVRPSENGQAPTVAYELTKSLPLTPTPLAKDGLLYLWTDDGVVSCVRAASGEPVWRERVGGSFYGSPVWVGGRLYCVARSGEVVVLAAGEKYELISRVPLGEPSNATPAVADGVMYLRTRSTLFSLGGRGAAKELFDGKTLKGWKETDFYGKGKVEVRDGMLVLGSGNDMTGVTYEGKPPRTNYELTLEGQRLDGSDFFCTTTFPVDKACCSFVVGGWGGNLVGLSNVDGYDAANNPTTQMVEFKEKTWYRLRIRVSDARIQCWIDDDQLVNQVRDGHKFSVRLEVDQSQPLGIATWRTKGAVRNIRLRALTAEEIEAAAEDKALGEDN